MLHEKGLSLDEWRLLRYIRIYSVGSSDTLGTKKDEKCSWGNQGHVPLCSASAALEPRALVLSGSH